jgi:hypothetical protein
MCKLAMRQELNDVLQQITSALPQGPELVSLHSHQNLLEVLRALLSVAGGWFYLGQTDRALSILKEVRKWLYQNGASRAERHLLAIPLVRALELGTREMFLQWIEELFLNLGEYVDRFSTQTHYDLSQLQLVETVVLALAPEEHKKNMRVD